MANTWLDHLSERDVAQSRRQAAAAEHLTVWGGRVLMVLTFFVLFVGFEPLQRGTAEATGGSALRQISFLALAVLAMPLVLTRWRGALAILGRSWPLLLVFAALGATTLWSPFPDVTVRRLGVLIVLSIAGLGLAAALPSPRQYLVPFVAAFAAVLIADVVISIIMPGRAFDALGLAALHPSKNVAGLVAQMMVITFAATVVAVRAPAAFWALIALTLVAFVFLYFTRSKTALGLTALCTFGLLPVLALAQRSVVMAFLLAGGLVAIVGAIVFATGALQLSGADWAVITTGDASFTNRDDIWRASLANIRERPWLGWGFGAMWSMWPTFHPLAKHVGFWSDSIETLRILNQSHNGYLDIMLHGGVFLASFVLLFVVKTFSDIIGSLGRQSVDLWQVAGNAFYGTFFVSLLFSNFLESTLFFPDGLGGQVFILLAIAHASWRQPRILERRGPSRRTNRAAASNYRHHHG